jgi:hypothetical protein
MHLEDRMRRIEEQEKEIERARQEEERKKKERLIDEIIKVKGSQIVRIDGKRLEDWRKEDLRSLELDSLEAAKKQLTEQLKDDVEKKSRNLFTKIDYLDREKREHEDKILARLWEKQDEEQAEAIRASEDRYRKNYETKQKLLEVNAFKVCEREREIETVVLKTYNNTNINQTNFLFNTYIGKLL